MHYVVTEYGVAYLHGKSVQERAMALISIAHPKFRAQLLREAIEAKYLSAEMADKEGKIIVGPKELRTTYLMNDGTQINFRPIHPTDEPLMRDLFYNLSQQTIYYRFMSNHDASSPGARFEDFVYIDHRNDVAHRRHAARGARRGHHRHGQLLSRPEDQPRGSGLRRARQMAEARHRHVPAQHLIRIARRNGIRGFTAEVLRENKAMQAVINKSNCKVSSALSGNVYTTKWILRRSGCS